MKKQIFIVSVLLVASLNTNPVQAGPIGRFCSAIGSCFVSMFKTMCPSCFVNHNLQQVQNDVERDIECGSPKDGRDAITAGGEKFSMPPPPLVRTRHNGLLWVDDCSKGDVVTGARRHSHSSTSVSTAKAPAPAGLESSSPTTFNREKFETKLKQKVAVLIAEVGSQHSISKNDFVIEIDRKIPLVLEGDTDDWLLEVMDGFIRAAILSVNEKLSQDPNADLTITISADFDEANSKGDFARVRFAVHDTGAGLSRKAIQALQQIPEGEAPKTDDKTKDGALRKSIQSVNSNPLKNVPMGQNHNLEVQINSNEGEGTRVSFSRIFHKQISQVSGQ